MVIQNKNILDATVYPDKPIWPALEIFSALFL